MLEQSDGFFFHSAGVVTRVTPYLAIILIPCPYHELDMSFENSKKFAQKVVSTLQPPIADNGTRFLLVAYGQSWRILFDSADLRVKSVQTAQYAISVAQPAGLGQANVTTAMHIARQLLLKNDTGDVENLCILLGDGSSVISSEAVQIAEELKMNQTELFVVKVGGENENDLVALVSTPSEKHLIVVSETSQLSSAAEVVCGNIPQGTPISLFNLLLW